MAVLAAPRTTSSTPSQFRTRECALWRPTSKDAWIMLLMGRLFQLWSSGAPRERVTAHTRRSDSRVNFRRDRFTVSGRFPFARWRILATEQTRETHNERRDQKENLG